MSNSDRLPLTKIPVLLRCGYWWSINGEDSVPNLNPTPNFVVVFCRFLWFLLQNLERVSLYLFFPLYLLFYKTFPHLFYWMSTVISVCPVSLHIQILVSRPDEETAEVPFPFYNTFGHTFPLVKECTESDNKWSHCKPEVDRKEYLFPTEDDKHLGSGRLSTNLHVW